MEPRNERLDREAGAVAKTANRVTLADIEANIAYENSFTAAQARHNSGNYVYASEEVEKTLWLLTICVLVLQNGFTVVGQSACADPANFNAEFGAKLAREDAIRQCWALMGYALRERMFFMTGGMARIES